MEDQVRYFQIMPNWAQIPNVSFCTGYPNRCLSLQKKITKNGSTNPRWAAAWPKPPAGIKTISNRRKLKQNARMCRETFLAHLLRYQETC